MHTLKLPLKITKQDELILQKRFALLAKMHNILVKHAQKLLGRVNGNKWYRKQLDAYAKANARLKEVETYLKSPDTDTVVIPALKKEQDELSALRKSLSGVMADYRARIGLTKGGLEAYCKKFQSQYKKHISSHIAQKEADHIWAGVEKVLFSEGNVLHFKKWDSFRTISSKSPTNGIRFYSKPHGIDYTPKAYRPVHKAGIEFMGLDIEVSLSGWDPYKEASLRKGCKLSYSTILREPFRAGYRYCVILSIDGAAPKKIPEGALGRSTAGADPGMSTFAYASGTTVAFEELAPESKAYNRRIAALQKRIDRSLRIHNPDNYNSDGTPQKGKRKWVCTRRCRRLRWQLKVLYRKKSACITCEHNNRANRVVRDAAVFITEAMDFKALAKRSKKEAQRVEKASVVRRKDGTEITVYRYKKKKRFGKSIGDRAPAAQLAVIQRKMAQYGGLYFEADTKSFRASQYDHVKDTYIKVPLSQRKKDVGGNPVQRDLYSAFLLGHALLPDMKKPDREACIRGFRDFLRMQDACIAYLKETGFSMPSCAGF